MMHIQKKEFPRQNYDDKSILNAGTTARRAIVVVPEEGGGAGGLWQGQDKKGLQTHL